MAKSDSEAKLLFNESSLAKFVPEQIVSGGQTGVDRGALDAARSLEISHGGWCPAGRLAEDGRVPEPYLLKEMPTRSYPDRTEQNVLDSSATLILYRLRLSGGTLLTRKICKREGKPFLAADLAATTTIEDEIRVWLSSVRPDILNVAGPRESNEPGIANDTKKLLIALLS